MAELFAKSASFTDKGIVEQQEAMEEDIFVDVETKSWSHCDMSRNISDDDEGTRREWEDNVSPLPTRFQPIVTYSSREEMDIVADMLERPTPPRFSFHWDPVNKEAYFDELTPTQADSECSLRPSQGGLDAVKVVLEKTLNGKGVKVHLQVVPLKKHPRRFSRLLAASLGSSMTPRTYKSCFQSIFSWCLNPQVRTW